MTWYPDVMELVFGDENGVSAYVNVSPKPGQMGVAIWQWIKVLKCIKIDIFSLWKYNCIGLLSQI